MRADDVLARAEAFALEHAATPDQRCLLQTAFEGARTRLPRRTGPPDYLDCVHIPRWVYAAVRGDDAPALPLAVVTTLLWVGIALLDDVMDGDLSPIWDGCRPAEVSLAGFTLVSATAPLALSTIDAAPATIVAMQQSLARGLLAMSGGQQRDVAMAGSSAVSAPAVEAAVAGKSGEMLAMFAAMAAQLARAPAEAVAAYAEMARILGIARQFHSDCYDLFAAPHSKDLANGTRTLPIALHLQQLAGSEREDFLTVLDHARTDPGARDAVRARLLDAGALHACAVVIELYCDRAGPALAQAQPREPGHSVLRRWIDDTRILGSRYIRTQGTRLR
jgi:geranylgeranyl pyrophosphate synthase